ncbi:MAG: hypothetical protein JEY96_01675 [Bacteroidales bacterium]|nr:hypothetical protein [Bacteroidales bacterium]
MKVTLQNTSKIVKLGDVPARIWEGETESGIKVHAFITRVAMNKDEDCSEFEKELQECTPPSTDVEVYPANLIL